MGGQKLGGVRRPVPSRRHLARRRDQVADVEGEKGRDLYLFIKPRGTKEERIWGISKGERGERKRRQTSGRPPCRVGNRAYV